MRGQGRGKGGKGEREGGVEGREGRKGGKGGREGGRGGREGGEEGREGYSILQGGQIFHGVLVMRHEGGGAEFCEALPCLRHTALEASCCLTCPWEDRRPTGGQHPRTAHTEGMSPSPESGEGTQVRTTHVYPAQGNEILSVKSIKDLLFVLGVTRVGRA